MSKEVLFDIYTYNNAWGFMHHGCLIFNDGTILSYKLTKEEFFNVEKATSISFKIEKGTIQKVIEERGINELIVYLNKINNDAVFVKRMGFDVPHTEYYGYKKEKGETKRRIHIASNGGTIMRSSDTTEAKVEDRLIALLNIYIKEENELSCHYCSTLKARFIDLDLIALFCDEQCRENYKSHGSSPRIEISSFFEKKNEEENDTKHSSSSSKEKKKKKDKTLQPMMLYHQSGRKKMNDS